MAPVKSKVHKPHLTVLGDGGRGVDRGRAAGGKARNLKITAEEVSAHRTETESEGGTKKEKH